MRSPLPPEAYGRPHGPPRPMETALPAVMPEPPRQRSLPAFIARDTPLFLYAEWEVAHN